MLPVLNKGTSNIILVAFSFPFKVGNKTSRKFTHCLCNHATFFGSLNVEPNPISTPTFEKLKEGYVMLIFVSVIFLLYFIGLIWARRKDRADVVKVRGCVSVFTSSSFSK